MRGSTLTPSLLTLFGLLAIGGSVALALGDTGDRERPAAVGKVRPPVHYSEQRSRAIAESARPIGARAVAFRLHGQENRAPDHALPVVTHALNRALRIVTFSAPPRQVRPTIKEEGSVLADGPADAATVDPPIPANAPPTIAPTSGPVTAPFPSPSATPEQLAARPSLAYPAAGGPLTFQFIGSLTAGERYSSNTQSGQIATPENSVGLTTTINRRTPRTSLSLQVPTTAAAHSIAVGQLQAEYDTTSSSLIYGPQNISALNILPLGGTTRGFGFLRPLRGGDLLVFSGPGYVNGSDGYRVWGIRDRLLLRGGVASLGFFSARAENAPGRMDGLDLAYATSSARWSTTAEALVERTMNLETGGTFTGQTTQTSSGAGIAYQLRTDYGGRTTYLSGTVRDLPSGFVGFGSSFQGDKLYSVTARTAAGKTNVALQGSHEVMGVGIGGEENDSRTTLSIDRPLWGSAQGSIFLTDDKQSEGDQTLWSGSANGTLSFDVRGVSMQANGQFERSTYNISSPSSTSSYGLQAAGNLLKLGYQASYQVSQQTALASIDRSRAFSAGISRSIGRASLSLIDSITRTITPVSDSIVVQPVFAVSRTISPTVTLTVQAGFQSTRDRLNPQANGRSSIFNISLGTPFSFGNGVATGRIDPRLPATIGGTVYNESTNFTGLQAISIPTGVGNIGIVLDGTQIQRTDSQGRFQFRFVKPGNHYIAIDDAALPRGLTPLQPYTNVTVAGGQVAQITLGIGSYGVLEGRVVGKDRSGHEFPISGAQLTLDKNTQTTVTGAAGYYGFGHLAAGQHSVEIRVDSLPAEVGLVGPAVRSVAVQLGGVATLDFLAAPLGSIAGHVMPQGTPVSAGVGTNNAYVIAEPGEHAAITNEDGSFLLDNLPPGTYTLSVDEETLSPDMAVTSGPTAPLMLEANQHLTDVLFEVGTKERPIVFSFQQGAAPVVLMTLDRAKLPPGGATRVRVTASATVSSVVVRGLDSATPLHYDAHEKAWVGRFVVPMAAKSGKYDIHADVTGASGATSTLEVDPEVPLMTAKMTPGRPARGQYAHVQAFFLANAEEGDAITWQDGAVTTLRKPVNGRIFVFDIKISELPYRGMLATHEGAVPIVLKAQ